MLTPRLPDRDERGAVTIVFAISVTMLLILAGLVIDLGFARDTRRQSQNSADAAALAAVNVLYPENSVCTLDNPTAPPCFKDAVKAAKDYAAANFGTVAADWASCSDTSHFYVVPSDSQCISFTDATLATSKPTQPTKVRVVMPTRDVKTNFGTLAGVQQVPINAVARSTLQMGSQRSCGLCVISPDPSDLGNGDVTVNGGSVQINGSVHTGPQGNMKVTPAGSSTISVVGTADGNFNPPAIGPPNATVVQDPLASLTLPPSPMPATAPAVSPCAGGPGRYGAYTVPTNTNCVLLPGLYVITGKWDLQANNSKLTALTPGVTLYFTCGTPAAPALCNGLNTGGQLDARVGDVQLVGATAAANTGYTGFAIIYDRTNTAGLNIQGNGDSKVTGTVYAVKSQLQFPGTSCVDVTNGPVIVGTLYGNGNTGCVNLLNVNSASLPPIPGVATLDQ